MASMSGWMFSMKVILISVGVVSVAMGIKLSVPIAVDGVPAVWSAVLSWMKPPYLYVIINCIIITIAVSSRFHQSQSEGPPPAVLSEHLVSIKSPAPSSFAPFVAQPFISSSVTEASTAVDEVEETVGELKSLATSSPKADAETEKEIEVDEAEAKFDGVLFNSYLEEKISPEVQFESLFPVREKPLTSSRFGPRKQIRSNPEGARALRVARPKKQETLESTWKAITEGRHVPLTRRLKKADAWDENLTVRIKKEASLGQDELNRRVEAFIKKFNEDMRMQRQESLNRFMEMMNRGV